MRNRVKEKEIPAALLNIYEFCDYLSIGETKARELLHDPGNGFTVRIGNRLYAHKGSVDKWLSMLQMLRNQSTILWIASIERILIASLNT